MNRKNHDYNMYNKYGRNSIKKKMLTFNNPINQHNNNQ